MPSAIVIEMALRLLFFMIWLMYDVERLGVDDHARIVVLGLECRIATSLPDGHQGDFGSSRDIHVMCVHICLEVHGAAHNDWLVGSMGDVKDSHGASERLVNEAAHCDGKCNEYHIVRLEDAAFHSPISVGRPIHVGPPR